jgi:hypothetical protein
LATIIFILLLLSLVLAFLGLGSRRQETLPPAGGV